MKANKGFVRAIIDPELKEKFNRYCMEHGIEILETTNAVVEHAFEMFLTQDIKTVKEQLEEKSLDKK